MKVFILIIILFNSFLLNSKTFYVSTNGSNSNIGSFLAPFKTIQYAVKKMNSGDKCIIRAGTYHGIIRINKSRISISNYKNEKVIICPKKIKRRWYYFRNGIYKTSIKDSVIQLILNNTAQNIAAFPSINNELSTKTWGDIYVDSKKEVCFKNRVPHFNRAYFIGLCGNKIVALNGTVIKSKNNKIKIIDNNAFYWNDKKNNGYNGKGKGFLVGNISFLNKKKEWFYKNGFLYYKPHQKQDLNNLSYNTTHFLIHFKKSNNIKLSGIQIIGGGINLEQSSNNLIFNCKGKFIGSFFKPFEGFNVFKYKYDNFFRYSNNKVIKEANKIAFSYPLLNQGMGVLVNGNNNKIQNCEFSSSWGNGITVLGNKNCIKNTEVYDCNWIAMDCSALSLAGVKNKIFNNSFHKCGRSVLLHRDISNCIIKYNDIYNGGIICNDLGLTYCYDSDGNNTEIANNWIHDNHATYIGSGIYLDNYSKNYIVHHNVVWNCFVGNMINQPCANHKIYNNTFWRNKYTMGTFFPASEKSKLSGVEVFNNISDSKLESVLYKTIVAETNYNNLFTNDIFEQLENPKRKDFRLKNNQLKVGACSSNDKWIPGIKRIEKFNLTRYLWPFLFVLYLSLFIYWINGVKSLKWIKINYKVLIVAIKLFAGIVVALIYTYYYPNRGTAEVFKYYDDGEIIYKTLTNHSYKEFFKFIFGINIESANIQSVLLNCDNWKNVTGKWLEIDHFLIRFNAFLCLFSGGNYWIQTLLFSFISSWTTFIFLNWLKNNGVILEKLILIIVIGTPSLLIWNSGTIEDTLLHFSVIYTFCTLYTKSKISINNIFKIIFSLSLCLFIFSSKSFILIALFPLIILKWLELIPIKRKGVFLVITYNVIVIGFFILESIHPIFHIGERLTFIQRDLLLVADEMHARTHLKIYPLDETILSFFKAIPQSVFNVFIGKMEIRPNGTLSIFYFIENWIIIAILILGIFSKIRLGIKSLSYPLTALFLFSSFNLIIIGWVIPITGVLARYKSMFIYFLVVIAVIQIYKKNEDGKKI